MPFIIILGFCIFIGLQLHNFYTLTVAIAIGVFVGMVVQLCWADAKRKLSTKSNIKKMNYETYLQEKYDNEYGIIFWEDKK